MKLDKNQQKQLINAIYISSDRRGYKTKTNTIYTDGLIGLFSKRPITECLKMY